MVDTLRKTNPNAKFISPGLAFDINWLQVGRAGRSTTVTCTDLRSNSSRRFARGNRP